MFPYSVETEDGDYMFCFDNTFSAVSEKIIFFELILDNMDTDEDPDDWKEYVHGTDMVDMKLEDIMVSNSYLLNFFLRFLTFSLSCVTASAEWPSKHTGNIKAMGQ